MTDYAKYADKTETQHWLKWPKAQFKRPEDESLFSNACLAWVIYQGFSGAWEAQDTLKNIFKRQQRRTIYPGDSLRRPPPRHYSTYFMDLDVWEVSILAPEIFDDD